MADVVFVAVMLGFFALAVGLVQVCERIVGRSELATLPTPAPRGEEEAAA